MSDTDQLERHFLVWGIIKYLADRDSSTIECATDPTVPGSNPAPDVKFDMEICGYKLDSLYGGGAEGLHAIVSAAQDRRTLLLSRTVAKPEVAEKARGTGGISSANLHYDAFAEFSPSLLTSA